MTTAIVHLLDHDAVSQQRISAFLANTTFSVQCHRDGETFLASLPSAAQCASQPACIVCPIDMAGMSALELRQQLQQRDCAWPMLLITTPRDAALAVEALRSGLLHLIEHAFDANSLIRAISNALHQAAASEENMLERMQKLTRRERQVLELVIAGNYNKTIADVLGISIKTVEQHRSNMMSKIGARNLGELIRLTLGYA